MRTTAILLLFAATGCAATPREYVCRRAGGPIEVDGRLDDAAWSAAPWTGDFVDIEGDAKPRPRLRTRAKLLHDDRCLYVAAELEEPDVRATLTERDSVIFHDDDFEVFLDPDGDAELYYELEINALGTVWDLLLVRTYRAGGPAVNGWDIRGLRAAVHVDGTLADDRDTDRGWTVEIALPWPALAECAGEAACPPAPGDRWRLNMSRVEWPATAPVRTPGHEENHAWSPQGVVDMHLPDRWGWLEFAGPAAGE